MNLWYILQYTCHQYLLMVVQVALRQNHITNHHKEWHLKKILIHATIHSIQYRTYQLIRIQTQVHQTLLCRSHLTHQTTSIINEDNVQKRTKINSRIEYVSMTQSKSAQILQPRNLHTRTHQRLLSSNFTRIYYSAGFISYPSLTHLKFYYHNFHKHTCYLWDIYP